MRTAKRIALTAAILAVLAGIGFLLRPVSYINASMFLHEELSGASSRFLRVDGIRIHYLVEGPASGPTVVLVHGLGGSVEDWRNLAPSLVHAGFRVYLPDLPGFGRSERATGFSYSIHDQASIVVAFMDALNLRHVILGGWSMGGWIAEYVAATHPDRIDRLIVFDAAGLNIKPTWNTALFAPSSPAELAQLDALLMPNPPRVPGFLVRDILRISAQRRWVTQRAVAQMLTAQDVTDHLLPQLHMPVLIVWGDLDHIMPVDQAHMTHDLIPQSQLLIVPGCGHLAPLQCSAQIIPTLISFIGH